MVRTVSLIAMSGGFLMISPKLRDSLLGGYSQAGSVMDAHSPYSYVVLGVAIIGALLIFLSRASQPR
jgi:hypothetical protein